MKTVERTTTNNRLGVVIKRSINDVDATVWDSIGETENLYQTHRFLSCVESSGVADAEFWYVLFYRDGQPVAKAVLSCFPVFLDLLLPGTAGRLCGHIRRVIPKFLNVRVLFCGLPISIGKHTLAINRDIEPGVVLRELDRIMLEITRDQKIGLRAFKEFTGDSLQTVTALNDFGYIKAHSLPRFELSIKWSSFSEYMQSMRHSYRRKVNLSIARLNSSQLTLHSDGFSKTKSSGARITVKNITVDRARQMNRLYQTVIQHAKFKLETLNEDFFVRLATVMPSDLLLITLEDDRDTQGMALLGQNGATLNFLLVGFCYETRDRYQTYFNLLNGIIAFGIENGFRHIDLGQTTHEAKQRLGGRPAEVYFFLHSLSPSLQFFLRHLNRYLFPPMRLPERRVFRQDESEVPKIA